MRQHHLRGAFTLIELLVVLAIIGILVALLLPAVQSIRESARRVECTNRIRQVAMAHLNFQSANRHFPRHMENHYSVFVTLLPHIEEGNLYNSIDFDALPSDDLCNNAPLLYRCPSEAISGLNSYKNYFLNERPNLRHRTRKPIPNAIDLRPRDFETGTSNVAIYSEAKFFEMEDGEPDTIKLPELPVGEDIVLDLLEEYRRQTCEAVYVGAEYLKYQSAIARNDWSYGPQGYNHYQLPNQRAGLNNKCLPPLAPPSSYHRSGVNIAFADGHVRFVDDSIDWLIWIQQGSREPVDSFLHEFLPVSRFSAYVKIGNAGDSGTTVFGANQTVFVIYKRLVNDRWMTDSITEPYTFELSDDAFP